MKSPKLYDRVRLLRDLHSEDGHEIKARECGHIVDIINDDVFAVEFTCSDTNLVGDKRFELCYVNFTDFDLV